MFERSQVNHNGLDFHKIFGIYSINCKVYMLETWPKSKKKLHVQNIQGLKMDNFYFFQILFFFLPNVHHSFWKSEKILTLILELLKIIFITDLNTFGSKVFLTLKIMDFENVFLTKVVYVYVIEGMNT